MRESKFVLPFFKDKNTTNAVLSVIFRHNHGIDAVESIPSAAAYYKVSESDVAMYWAVVKNQAHWINQ